MTSTCPSVRRERCWPASRARRAKLRPVPSRGPSIGAAGAEPGAIPALNSNPGTAGRDAAEAVTRGGRCQTIRQRGQAGQSVTTGRLARATGRDDTLDPHAVALLVPWTEAD